MGTSRWSDSDWVAYSKTTTAKSAAEIFTSTKLHPELNPKGVVMRESRDSAVNPNSTAIIIGVDVTGSMGVIADYFVKTGLGNLFKSILDRKPVSDPHLMVMGIGDANYDSSPFQVSQFEADLSIAKQLENIHVEKGGGGNSYESYELPWYFAAYHTSIDCFEKRGKKGYLFTIGDEETPPGVTASQVANVIGDTPQHDIPLADMLETVGKMYNVYHVMVAQGSHFRSHGDRVKQRWTDLMGQNAILLRDFNALAEVIESVIEVSEGRDKDAVVASWSGGTAIAVRDAVADMAGALTKAKPAASAVVRF